MLVHSCIYYNFHNNVISDDKWQEMANELRDLQSVHGEKFDCYDEAFHEWTGATGMHLSVDDWVINKALSVQRLEERMRSYKHVSNKV